MTLKDAKALRDYILSKNVINCTVPLGHCPDNYFPRSFLAAGPHDWTSKQQFREWLAKRRRQDRRNLREYERIMSGRRRQRSAIEMMVDRACGLG